MFSKKLIAIFTLLFFLFQSTSCLLKGRVDYESTNKEVERLIKEDSVFRDIDNLCSQIPLPDDFKLIGKNKIFRTKGIGYGYRSKHNFEYVEKFFKDYFLQKGWDFSETKTLTKGVEFTNEVYQVEIYYLADEVDYSISCAKKTDVNENK